MRDRMWPCRRSEWAGTRIELGRRTQLVFFIFQIKRFSSRFHAKEIKRPLPSSSLKLEPQPQEDKADPPGQVWILGWPHATFAFRSRRRDSRTLRPNLRQGQSKWDVRPGSALLRSSASLLVRLAPNFSVRPCRPDPTNPDQKPLKRLVDPTANGKKRRELYVGNLPQHKAQSPEMH